MSAPVTAETIAARLSEPYGSFPQIIADWAALQPDKPALRDESGVISWGVLGDRVERIAARLVADGLERGQSVAILGYSSMAYALVFLGAVRAGGVAAPLTTSASPDQLAGMARDSGARHIFIDRFRLTELGDECFPGMTKIVLDEELDGWMAPSGTTAPPFEPAETDPFNIIYSSGTTGIPKGIVHSHLMRWRQFATTASAFHATGMPIVSIASTPLYSNTTMVAFLPPLLAGGTVRVMGKFDCGRWLDYAQADRSTITMLVPVQYQRLMDYPDFDRFDLSAMAVKYCTSAPFSAELKREVLNRMPGTLTEIYSMTEGGVVCLLNAHEFPDKLHTVGRPSPVSQLKVLDDNDQPVPPGTPGNLIGRSPTMMSGYKNQDAKTREGYWTDPETGEVWQRMGDIGRIDEDGFVELVGRAKDMIISGGFNIFPSDLEAALEADARVAEAAVIGVASRKWGETPVGFVRLAEGTDEGELSAIMAATNGKLGKTQRLALLLPIDEMPRSHIGKLLKTDLRALAERTAQVD